MAWQTDKPTDSGLLINFPGQARANWDAVELGTDAALLVTNAKVAAAAAITESKILFAATGHGHTGGTGGKQVVLTTAVSGTLPIANGGTNSTSTPNTANGVVILDGTAKLPAVDGSALTGIAIVNTAQTVSATNEVIVAASGDIPQMTLTTASAGTYLILFNSTWYNVNAYPRAQLVIDGSVVCITYVSNPVNDTNCIPVSMHWVAVIATSKIVKVNLSADSGGTFCPGGIGTRVLSLVKIA